MRKGQKISSVTPSLVKYPFSDKQTPTHALVNNTNGTHRVIKKSKNIMYVYENTIMRLIIMYN